MKIRLLFFGFLLIFCSNHVIGQNERFTDPATFSTEMTAMMARTKSPQAQEIAMAFDVLWNGGTYSEGEKEKIAKIAAKMNEKHFPSRPHFENFLASFVYAANNQNFNSSKLSKLLDVSLRTVEVYEEKELGNYFATLKTLFDHNALFYSSFSKLFIENESYEFVFVEPVEEINEEIFEEEPESTGEDEWFDDWDDETSNDDWDTDWDEQETVEEAPGFEPLTEQPQPTLEGPVIKFSKVDLIMSTSFDSTSLVNTSGSLMMKDLIFVGNGGKFDWQVAGLSSDSVFCTFEKYNFDISKSRLSAENVVMTYKGKLKQPVKGVFDFESKRHDSPDKSKFPRFKSYENDVNVNFAPDGELIYKGGFSMEGRKISSSSFYAGPASIEVVYEGNRMFRSRAKRYILGDSIVEADLASVVIYEGRDSIMHPAIRIKYNYLSRNLVVLKDVGRYKYAPFFASFFNMDITVDMIKWDIASDSLDFSILNARSQIPAYFESQEYFNPDRFGEMAGIYKFHPLFLLIGYSRKINSSEFNVGDLIEFSKQPANVVRSAMEFLMSYHFIDYNSFTGDIKIRRKAYHNVLSKNQRKDYDNLLIASKLTNKPNATYKLKENELIVRGVEKFYISELLDVYIIPKDNEIRLKKNRDFTFDGQLFAGNFEYIGKDFTFRYDSFLVDMQTIDSVRFYIQDDDTALDKKKLDNKIVGSDSTVSSDAIAQSNMQRTSGTLLINKPNNKSARRVYPGYPSFSAESGAVVYFSGKEILGGAYADLSVYFVIPPFKIDSLSESDVRSVGFEGTFVTSGLLPEFKEKLQIMPDKSLGFVHQAPIDGYAISGDKGRFYKTLTMDKNGLRGNGKVEYLTATLESDDFIFYPDSIVTTGANFKMDNEAIGDANYPDLVVDAYKMKWLPQKDSMFIHNITTPFELYDATASLNGFVNITPNGVLGGGQLLTRGSEAISNELSFTSNSYAARHADFTITSDNPEKAALSGDDIRIQFNLDENIADISPEVEGIAAINFPYAQMKTSITNAKWNLEDRSVTMEKPEDVDINSSYFYSTREELDSLAFNAAAAKYDINSLQLHVSGIPFIKVADAKITPDNNELTILENSELQPLENANLVIDTLNSYHNLSDGNITIISRKEFVGDATYDLVAAADTFGIKFNSFELEPVGNSGKKSKQLQTVSRGTIEEIDRIMVSPKMIFKGTTTMYATKQALELDGFVKLDLKKISGYDTWIEYKSISDTQQVIIEYDQIVTQDGTSPASGLYFENGEFSLYPTIISEPRSLGDEAFFLPKGKLLFSEDDNAFIIEESQKSSGNSFSGRSFVFDEDNAKISFEGPMQFISPNSTAKIKAAGLGVGNFEKDEYKINTFMVFDYDLPAAALNSLAFDFQDVIERVGLAEAHENKTDLLYKAAEIIGNKAAVFYDEKSSEDYTPLVSVSNELAKALVLSDFNLEWSGIEKAFYNPLNSKIGVSNILRNDINAKMDGFIEIRKTENGDIINLFLKASSAWYYFGYSDNRLVLYSNNQQFNDIIQDKTNVAKAKIGEYVFILGEINEVQNFVDEFRKVYYDIDEPFELDQPSQVVAGENTLPKENEDPLQETTEDDDEGF